MREFDMTFQIAGSVSLASPEAAADVLRRAGWKIRKAGFHEFESVEENCDIYIESASPVLLHGPAVDAVATGKRLADAFQSAGICYSFELYDADRRLVATLADEKKT